MGRENTTTTTTTTKYLHQQQKLEDFLDLSQTNIFQNTSEWQILHKTSTAIALGKKEK